MESAATRVLAGKVSREGREVQFPGRVRPSESPSDPLPLPGDRVTPEFPPAAPEDAARAVVRHMRAAVALAVTAVALLSFVGAGDFWQALGLGLLGVLLPALALAQLPLLGMIDVDRVSIYRGSCVTILAVGGVAAALGWLSNGEFLPGLAAVSPRGLLFWTAAATGGGLALIGVSRALGQDPWGSSPGFVLRLIPRTPREKRLFVGLSIVAGLGEEVAYRGYLLSTLELLGLGQWIAAVGSSAAFGLLHAYQGAAGIVRTGLTGLLLVLPVFATGSLIPSILAHACINLIAGLVIGPRLLAEGEAPP